MSQMLEHAWQEELNQFQNYPDDAREPVISTVDANANAIAAFQFETHSADS